MTVKELIEKLKKFDPDLICYINDHMRGDYKELIPYYIEQQEINEEQAVTIG